MMMHQHQVNHKTMYLEYKQAIVLDDHVLIMKIIQVERSNVLNETLDDDDDNDDFVVGGVDVVTVLIDGLAVGFIPLATQPLRVRVGGTNGDDGRGGIVPVPVDDDDVPETVPDDEDVFGSFGH